MPLKKLIFILLVIPLTGYILYLSKAIISPFILAFFLAYAINPLVEWLQKRRPSANSHYSVFSL